MFLMICNYNTVHLHIFMTKSVISNHLDSSIWRYTYLIICELNNGWLLTAFKINKYFINIKKSTIKEKIIVLSIILMRFQNSKLIISKQLELIHQYQKFLYIHQ